MTEAAAKIESGELLGTVLTTLIQDITALADQILGNVSLEELLGASGWDNTNKEMAAIDGRTPLLRPTESGKTVFSAALVLLGWADTNGDGILEIPQGPIRKWDTACRSSWINWVISAWTWIL